MDASSLPLAKRDGTGKAFVNPEVGYVVEKGKKGNTIPYIQARQAAIAQPHPPRH
jgi:hypothetical protein